MTAWPEYDTVRRPGADGNKMQTNPLVGITDYIEPPADLEREGFPEAEFIFLRDWRGGPEAEAKWRSCDALLAWHFPISGDTLDLLDACRIVVRYGVGYDTIDVQGLHARDIPLCNTPDYGTEEVADTACAMILALQRKIVGYDRACRDYGEDWQRRLPGPLERTNRCTVGVVGVGRIGTALINRLRPFGYRIVGYDPYRPSGHEKAVGYVRVASLEELLTLADVVTLHCPLTDETRGMIDRHFFETMKPGSSFVNTARGGLLHSLDDLEAALRTGHLASAALDVLPSEPPESHPLLDVWKADEKWLSGRLIINPHVAWYSAAGWREMRTKAAQTARLYLAEGRLRNRIPPGGETWR